MAAGGGSAGSGEVDVVIVGAGASGLAAARAAPSLGLTVAVLEAKDRIGGRAFTDRVGPGLPWDAGASWLQNARRNAFRAYADAVGFAYDTGEAPDVLWTGTGWADDALLAERDAYYEAAFAAIRAAGAAGRDVPAAAVVPPHPRFAAMFASWSAALSGVEPDRMSTLDGWRYDPGDANWLVDPGYGALVAHFGAEVPVALATPARRIAWGGAGVAVETPRGTVRGRAAIVTVSTNVLAAGAIAFDPPLPLRTAEALAAVPLGEAEKVALAFDRDVFGLPAQSHLEFLSDTTETISFLLRPFGRNLAVGFLAGRFAADLAAAGPAAMAAFAEERLAAAFGRDIRRRLSGVATTRWTADPDIRGGYSCTLPGAADRRPVLMEPIGDRLFLAGEACSLASYGTVHGAHEAGVAALRAAAARLGRAG